MQKLLVCSAATLKYSWSTSTGAGGMSGGVTTNHETRSTSGDTGGIQSDESFLVQGKSLMFSGGEIIKCSM